MSRRCFCASEQILRILHEQRLVPARRFPIHRLALFGSWARGDACEDSDVDVLVEVDPSIGMGFIELAEELETALGRHVDLVSRRAIRPGCCNKKGPLKRSRIDDPGPGRPRHRIARPRHRHQGFIIRRQATLSPISRRTESRLENSGARFALEERVPLAVHQHLLYVVRRELDLNVHNLAILDYRDVNHVHESGVRSQVQLGVALPDLLVQFRIEVDAVSLDKGLGRLVVPLGRDPLDLCQELAVEDAELLVVVDHEIGLALPDFLGNNILGQSIFVDPVGDHRPVAHVSLGDGLSGQDPDHLGQQAVADAAVIVGFGRFDRGQEAELDHLGIHDVVEGKQVGPGLLDRRMVALQSFHRDPGKKLAGGVAQDLVQVGVDIAGQGPELARPLQDIGRGGEFRSKPGGQGRLRVGVGDIAQGHGLGAVDLPDPGGVGQVDADRCRGIGGPAKLGGIDDLGRYPLDLLAPKAGVDRRVVLEPLRGRGDGLSPLGGFEVLEVDQGLPGGLAAHRVVVDLDEAVDEVDEGLGVGNPQDVVFVKLLQVTRLIIFDELLDDLSLLLVLGHSGCLLEPIDDLLDGRAVKAADPGDLLDDLAVLLDQAGVQAIGNRLRIALLGHGIVEALHLGLADALVEVHGRVLDQVLGRIQADLLGVHRGVEEDGLQKGQQAVQGLPLSQRERDPLGPLGQGREVFEGELGDEFVVSVVVVDAVGKPDPLYVGQELGPLRIVAVALVALDDGVQGLTDDDVVLVVLGEDDVPPGERGLAQVVNQLLLGRGQGLESLDLVAKDLNVGELVDLPLEGFGLGFGLRLGFFAGSNQDGEAEYRG